MAVREIKNVAVIGGGLMGSGIAQLAAQSGYNTVCREINQQLADKVLNGVKKVLNDRLARNRIDQAFYDATLSRLRVTADLAEAVQSADIVIEAVPESPKLKQDLLKSIEEMVPDDVILASNTSGIAITEIASVLRVKDRMIGTHFFQPAPVMLLMEVGRTMVNSDELVDTIVTFGKSLGRVPVVVKDRPGFLSGRPSGGNTELVSLLEEGIADIPSIDRIGTGRGNPMGPCTLRDFICVDTMLNILTYQYEKFGRSEFMPPIRLTQMVQLNRLGRKTGKGFYDYGNPIPQPDTSIDKEAIKSIKNVAFLSNDAASPIAAALKQEDYNVRVAGREEIALAVKGADVIFEELSDDLAQKQKDLAAIEAAARDDAIIIPLTWVKSITQIAQQAKKKSRIVGAHFLTPVAKTRIMELPCTSFTSEETRNRALHLLRSIGRDPVPTRDVPGHVQARLEMPEWWKDMSALQDNQGSAWDVDAMQIYGHNHPHGPLENLDEEGLDRVLDAMEYLYAQYGKLYFNPPQILRQKVWEGKLGKKTGEGFHKYDAEGKIIR